MSSTSSSSSFCSSDLHTPTQGLPHVPEQIQTAAMPSKRRYVDGQTAIITPPQSPTSCPSIPHVPITNTTTTTSSSTPTTRTSDTLSTTTTSATSPKTLTSMSIDKIHGECAEATDYMLILQQNNYVQPHTQQQQPTVNHIQHFNPNYEKEDDNENGELTIKQTKPNKKSPTTTTENPNTKKANNYGNEYNEKKPKRKYNKRNKTEDKAAAPPSPPPPTERTSSNPKRKQLTAVWGCKLSTNKKKISIKLIKPRPISKLPSPSSPSSSSTSSSSSSCSFDQHTPRPSPLHVPEQLQTATMPKPRSLIIPKKRQSVDDQTTIIFPPQPPTSIQSPLQLTPVNASPTSPKTTKSSTQTSLLNTPKIADAATETTPSISAKNILSYFVDSNGVKLLSAEATEYYKSEPEIQRITWYIFPDDKKRVFDEIMKTKTHEETLSPERLHAATADISDLNTFEKCEGCKLSTERYMVETNVIPDKVFSVNKSPIDYIKHKIIAPKLPREPTSELAENEFYEMYRKLDNGNFEKVPKSPDGKCMVYSYIHSNYTKNKFFAIFSQTNRVHYCNYEDFKYVRKSELHRSAPFIKLTGSTRHYRYNTYPTSVVLYSYMEDLFIELPNDDFFVNKFSTDPNEKYVLRVKKSSSSSFNYIMSNRDTLHHALVYGTYQTEQVFMGKFGTGNKYSLDDLIEPTGHALLHSTVFHEDRSQIKISTLIGMQYACCKYENLLQQKG